MKVSVLSDHNWKPQSVRVHPVTLAPETHSKVLADIPLHPDLQWCRVMDFFQCFFLDFGVVVADNRELLLKEGICFAPKFQKSLVIGTSPGAWG